MERLVLVGVPVAAVVPVVVEAIVPTIVHLHAKIAGVLLGAVGAVTPRVEITDLDRIVVVNVTIRVKTMGVEKSVILHAITVIVRARVAVVVPINVVIAKVTVTPVVLVPPIQDFKYN